MDREHYIQELFRFLAKSPTSFHCVQSGIAMLRARGFRELREDSPGPVTAPGSYFLTRNGSSLIAFTLTGEDPARTGLRMAGAHTDSPALKIKPRPELKRHGLLQLGVEVYGGALLHPWFDRELTIAGRVTIRTGDGSVSSVLVDFGRPVAVIPSLAIHLDRESNEKKPINKETDLVPILMEADDETPSFTRLLQDEIAREHSIGGAEILGHDLFFCDARPPVLTGMKEEFLTGPRLDNLLSCHALLQGLVDAEGLDNALIVLNDHEEIGSRTHCGAHSPFLHDILARVMPDESVRAACLNRSLFISADNAHAVHPNFADRHDANHQPRLNRGVVIKYNASQRYATTARTAAFFRLLAERAEVEVQEFAMRSDLACGSTIGPITAGGLGVQTLDIGVPSLAMHSIRETAGIRDCHQLYRAMRTYFAATAEESMWRCLHE